MSQSDSSPTKQPTPEAGLDNGKSQEISDEVVNHDKNTSASPSYNGQYDPTEKKCDEPRIIYYPPPINSPIRSPVYNPFGSVCSSGDSPSTHVYSPFGSGCGTRSFSYSPSYSPPSYYCPTTPVYNPCHTLRSSPLDSSPTKQKPGLGGDESIEVNTSGTREEENDKNGSPLGSGSFDPYSPPYNHTSPRYCPWSPTSSPPYNHTSPRYCPWSPTSSPPYHPTSPRYCPWSPTRSPPYHRTSPRYCSRSPTRSPPEDYPYGPKDMAAEKNKTGDTLKEIGDESSHVDGRNDQEAEAFRIVHVPCAKVDLLVGAVATLRFLQHNLCSRIYILKDSEVDLKSAQRPVELTGTVAQIEFAQKLIDSVLAEENYEEPMEVEAEKQSSKKDCNTLIEKVAESDQPKCNANAATSPRT